VSAFFGLLAWPYQSMQERQVFGAGLLDAIDYHGDSVGMGTAEPPKSLQVTLSRRSGWCEGEPDFSRAPLSHLDRLGRYIRPISNRRTKINSTKPRPPLG
jgi:hypothetical protein